MKRIFTCYCCDNPEESREHAPPKCLFPEKKYLPEGSPDYRQNLITVPSCEKHNLKKSGDDKYLFKLFSLGIWDNKIADPMIKKWIKDFERRSSLGQRIFYNAKEITLLSKKGDLLVSEKTVAVNVEIKRVYKVIESIVRALYYHESNYEKKWLKDIRLVSSLYIQQDFSIDKTEYKLYSYFSQAFEIANLEKKGSNPDIFFYQIHHVTDKNIGEGCLIKMVFYNSFVFFALLG